MALNVDRGMNLTSLNTTMQIRQMDPKSYQLRANYSAFVVLLTLLGMKRSAKAAGRSGFVTGKKTKNCGNPKFEWHSKDNGTPLTNAAQGAAANATTLIVTAGDGKMFTKNDLIYNRNTNEVMLVTNVVTDTLTVVRGLGTLTEGTSGEAVTADDVIVLVSSVFPEGSGAPVATQFKPQEFYNYTQIFKKTIENSKTNEATEYYGNINKMSTQHKDAFDEYLLQKSRAYFLGQRTIRTDSDGKPQRATGGLDYFIKTNVMVKKSFGYPLFMEFAERAYGYGGDEKIFICNPAMATLIQKEVLSNKINMEVSPKTKEFGINIKRLQTVSGAMDILVDHTMRQIYQFPTGFALETNLIEEMVLRPDTWESNIQEKDVDGLKDQLIGETGLKVVNEQRHAKLVIDPQAAD
ncbi:MAG: DUF5309 family protein [Pusillimonas sp.]